MHATTRDKTEKHERSASHDSRNNEYDVRQPTMRSEDKCLPDGEAHNREHRAIWDRPTAGFPPSALSAIVDGEKCRWERADEIGRGGNGVVFLYVPRPPGHPIAAKLVKVELNGGRCRRPNEYLVLKKHLKPHPNIINLHACFLDTEEAEVLIVMEFCAGGSVKDLMEKHNERGERISTRFLMHFIASIAEALGFLHGGLRYLDDGKTVQRDPTHQPVVHRDLKLANILLRQPYTNSERDLPEIVLADFGSAELVPIRTLGASSGTDGLQEIGPNAQEQRTVSPTSDIYALGRCLCELLTCGVFVLNDGYKEAYETSGLKGTAFSLELLKRCLSADLQCRPSTEDLFLLGRKLKAELALMAGAFA